MTSHARLVLTFLTLGVTIAVGAETPSLRANPVRTPGPIITALDSDRNGTLSAAEIASASLVLAALDVDGDAVISPAEQQAIRGDGRRGRSGATAFNVAFTLDANHDGDLQWLEIANAVSSLKRLDRNGDGQLTPDELRPVIVAKSSV